MNIFDWFLTGIVAYSAWRGMRAGFFGSLIGVAKVIAGFAAAISFSGQLSAYLDRQWNFSGVFVSFFKELFKTTLGSEPSYLTPDGLWELFKSFNLPEEWYNELLAAYETQQFADFSDVLLHQIAASLLEVISFVFIFAVTVALLGPIAAYLISRIFDLTLLGPFNRIGGLLLGTAIGTVAVLLLTGVLTPLLLSATVTSSVDGSNALIQMLTNSKLLPYFLKLRACFGTHVPSLSL